MCGHILEINNVTKRYSTYVTGSIFHRARRYLDSSSYSRERTKYPTKVLLSGVNLSLDTGDRLALVGASAAGKSTLVKMIFGLEKPSSGEICYDGIQITYTARDEALTRIRKEARLILQDPRSSFDPKMTLFASVSEPLIPVNRQRGSSGDKEQYAEVVLEALAKVGLNRSLQNYYPHQLSGGQLQRAAIARAIVSDPKLIVADEMLSALDPSRRKEISDLFINMLGGKSLIFIAHDLNAVRYLCNKIAVLNRGQIVDYGLLEEVLADPKDSYTKDLIRADTVFGSS